MYWEQGYWGGVILTYFYIFLLGVIIANLAAMLNPFLIEKDSMFKIMQIREAAIALRTNISKTMLGMHGGMSNKMKAQLKGYISVGTPEPNKYTCKVCGMEFNDGRKLGGHVSRAHKGPKNVAETGAGLRNQGVMSRLSLKRRAKKKPEKLSISSIYSDSDMKEQEMEPEEIFEEE